MKFQRICVQTQEEPPHVDLDDEATRTMGKTSSQRRFTGDRREKDSLNATLPGLPPYND